MTDLPHRRLRVPQEDGAALVDPPLSQVAALIASNRAKLAEFDRRAGFPANYRIAARSELSIVSDPPPAPGAAVIMAGHQPTLFHPGVWFKNFLLSSIGKHVGGRAVNMVADNDTIRAASIRVPTGAEVVDVSFDAAGEEIPWEERRVVDGEILRRFPSEVRRALSPQHFANGRTQGLLLDRLWPLVTACAQEQSQVGAALARGRHQLERQLGLETHEFALSGFDRSPAYFAFAARLLREHRELHRIHNAALAEYRLVNRIRSHSHPVADLAQDGEWFESPFWLWTASQPRRRRAFVRRVGGGLELTDRRAIVCPLSDAALANPGSLREQIVGISIKLRPRALITTMYARLVLCELFIHGIGGAKYDELTDAIVRRFFAVEPPAHLTATATFRLPAEPPQASLDDVLAAARRIRDVRFRPESLVTHSLLAGDSALQRELSALASQKRDYIRNHKLRGGSRDVYLGLDRINRGMHARLRDVERELRDEHAQLVEQVRRSQLLDARDFSFVLFPEQDLVPRLLELSKLPA